MKALQVSPDSTAFLLRNTALSLDEDETALPQRIARRFQLEEKSLAGFRIVRKGIDARRKSNIKYIYTVEFSVADPVAFWGKYHNEADLEQVVRLSLPETKQIRTAKKVVITGSGPARDQRPHTLSSLSATGCASA